MWIKSSSARKAALWLAGSFVFAAVIEPLVYSTLQDHGALKRPETWLWAMIIFIAHVVATRWFDVVAAFLVGLAAGLWADVFLRRREAPAAPLARASVVAKVSDLKPELTPVELLLQFHGGPNAPTELRSENVLQWYTLWNAEFNSFFTNEDRSQREKVFSMPRTWTIFVLFDKPAKFKQITVLFGSDNGPGFEVKSQNAFTAIITSNGDIPAGVLAIRSNQ